MSRRRCFSRDVVNGALEMGGRPFIDIHRHYLNIDHDGDDGRPALSCLTFLAPWTVSDDSLAQTPDESQQTEDDIHKEIARLEAQLRSYVPISPKKSMMAAREFVDMANTVSEKETKADSAIPRQTRPATMAPVPPSSKVPTPLPPKSAPSAVLAELAKNKCLSLNDGEVEPSHSVVFADKPAEMKSAAGLHHDERLALIEYFAPGLYGHKPPFDDPKVGYTAFSLPNVVLSSSVKYPRVTIKADDEGRKADAKRKGKQKQQPPKPSGKKYVNMKLVDIGSRSRSASSAPGGKAIIRWDVFLSALFEPDGFDVEPRDNGSKENLYKGGSRGAFESMFKLKETNHATSNPHPTNNTLALTLESAGTITATGRAKDLGMCSPYLSVAGHLTCRTPQSRNENPPTILHGNGEDAEGSATYVVSGHVVKSPGKGKRRLSGCAKDADEAFKTLLDRDKEGMKVVIAAREFTQKEDGKKMQRREP
ncbi:hypothetical protein ARMGADRAFT_1040627 [Armillaria gallica]|uniref:Uncharacterized protein n=1 Tax=Armillaria gallica TaxID=47427 RepID=A0A2H3CMP5_ARMGA|nr:hypothetical protein ARMGADRAFT_1040627 [Armillaria gallica]